MDVELYILPLAEASEFVTEELGGKKERKTLQTQALRDVWFLFKKKIKKIKKKNQPSHLSMNFWKIFPLKLSQISTMYGCGGTETQVQLRSGFQEVDVHVCDCSLGGVGGVGNNVGEATLQQRAASTFQINI